VTITSKTDTRIEAGFTIAPAAPAGPRLVRVVLPAGPDVLSLPSNFVTFVVEVPTVTSITPSRGLIGSTTAVTINGSVFGTNPTVQAGSGITVNINSASNTQISANFVVASNAPTGNHNVTVTAGGQTSNSVNFFVQVPTSLARLNHPGAPGGVGPLVVIDPSGNVVTLNGTVKATNMCGVYRNVAYDLVDQQGQHIDGTYTLTESFTDYQGSFPPGPQTQSFSFTPGALLTDIHFLGFPAPQCLGSNQNETFRQRFTITAGQGTYLLTTVVRVTIGRFSGTYRADVVIETP